jgi:hypothetical protein
MGSGEAALGRGWGRRMLSIRGSSCTWPNDQPLVPGHFWAWI